MNSPSSAPSRFEPPVPPPVNLDQETRKRIVAGVKAVLARLQKKRLLPDDAGYSAIIADPDRLLRFIETYRANRDAAADLVVDAQGRPVADDEGLLHCRVTLPQVERLLVATCARKVFESLDGESGRGERRLLLEDLRPLLAFSWQLPLLRHYAMLLDRRHVAALGSDLLLLRDGEGLRTVAGLDRAVLRQARQALGTDFREVLATAPAALENVVWLPSRHLSVVREALQDAAWRFCARERAYLETVMARDPAFIKAVGPVLADLPTETVRELEQLPVQRVRPLLNVFFTVFEGEAETLLVDPRFGRKVLSGVTSSLSGGHMANDEFLELAYLKLTALKGRIDAIRGT